MADPRPSYSRPERRRVALARLVGVPMSALPAALPARVLEGGSPTADEAGAALFAWALATASVVTVVVTGRCRRALGVVSSDAQVVLGMLVAGPVGGGAALVVVALWRAVPLAGAAATAAVALAVTIFVRAYGTAR